MTATKRSKNSRLRGTHTHGYGSKKKHRGAGSRGGRGMAGTGKRGDVKKPSIWKNKKYFGKHGFKKKNITVKIKTITITAIEQMLLKLVSKKLVEEKSGVFEIDLKKLGYNKLLSTGKATKKMKITTSYASAGAIEKVKAAGGEVIVSAKAKSSEKLESKIPNSRNEVSKKKVEKKSESKAEKKVESKTEKKPKVKKDSEKKEE